MTSKAEAVEKMKSHATALGSVSYDVGALSDAIDEVFQAYGTEDIAELVLDLIIQEEINPAQGSNILRVAVWSGNENGRSLLCRLDEWLKAADDPLRVALALDQEVYPFADADEMRAALSNVAQKFSEHAERCSSLINSRPPNKHGRP
jgi:hypothetical protein